MLKFGTASKGGGAVATLYTASGTAFTDAVVTIDNTLTFQNGDFEVKNASQTHFYAENASNRLAMGRSSTDANAFLTIRNASSRPNALRLEDLSGNLQVHLGTAATFWHSTTGDDKHLFYSQSGVTRFEQYHNNSVIAQLTSNGSSYVLGNFAIGNSTRNGSATLEVQGANTLSSGSNFSAYNGDTTPRRVFDIRNNGEVRFGDLFTGVATDGSVHFQNSTAGSDVLVVYSNTATNGGGRHLAIGTNAENYPFIGGNTNMMIGADDNGGSNSINLLLQASARRAFFRASGRDFAGFDENGDSFVLPQAGSGFAIAGITGLTAAAKLHVKGDNGAGAEDIAYFWNSAGSQAYEILETREQVRYAGTSAPDDADLWNGSYVTFINSGRPSIRYKDGSGTASTIPIGSLPSNQSSASTATLNINSDNIDLSILTAQAVALTVAAPTGTPVQGQKLIIRIKDNATSQTITWNAIFRAIGVTLPAATTISKTLYIGCVYNSTDSKWDVVAVNEEA